MPEIELLEKKFTSVKAAFDHAQARSREPQLPTPQGLHMATFIGRHFPDIPPAERHRTFMVLENLCRNPQLRSQALRALEPWFGTMAPHGQKSFAFLLENAAEYREHHRRVLFAAQKAAVNAHAPEVKGALRSAVNAVLANHPSRTTPNWRVKS